MISPRVSWRKTIVSSTRLINSGRKFFSISAITRFFMSVYVASASFFVNRPRPNLSLSAI